MCLQYIPTGTIRHTVLRSFMQNDAAQLLYMRLEEFLQTIPITDALRGALLAISDKGGTANIVGGANRNAILGLDAHDIDIEVFNVMPSVTWAILESLGATVKWQGKEFGVIVATLQDGVSYEFAAPRRERLKPGGTKHQDFDIEADPFMSIEEAANRRDFTINAMSFDPITDRFYDPSGGLKDLEEMRLRHVSERFSEDPVRVLKGARHAAEIGVAFCAETCELAKSIVWRYPHITKERIYKEWRKILLAKEPGNALIALRQTGWISVYPELEAMIGCPQNPKYHPEGWSFLPFSALPPHSTGTALTKSIHTTIRECVDASTTNKAAYETRSGAFRTEIGHPRFPNLEATSTAPVDRPPLQLSVTTLTKALGLMWPVTTTSTAESVRIVLEVSLPSVRTVMGGGGNDLEIIERIIGFVAVPVMNMFFAGQHPTDRGFDNQTVNANGPTTNGAIDVKVSRWIAVDSIALSVNNRVWIIAELDRCQFAKMFHGAGYTETYFREGDAWDHTVLSANMAAHHSYEQEEDRFIMVAAALVHDFGKPTTTVWEDEAWKSPGHAEAGVAPAKSFLESLMVHESAVDRILPLVRFHMHHLNWRGKAAPEKAILRLAYELRPANLEMLYEICKIDHEARGAASGSEASVEQLILQGSRLSVMKRAQPPLLTGDDVLPYYGGKGCKELGEWVKASYERQLDYKVRERGDALAWLDLEMCKQRLIVDGEWLKSASPTLEGRAFGDMLDAIWQAQKEGKVTSAEDALTLVNGRLLVLTN
jgi:tRNA nucleotidyltransferase/poly(A) polymerase